MRPSVSSRGEIKADNGILLWLLPGPNFFNSLAKPNDFYFFPFTLLFALKCWDQIVTSHARNDTSGRNAMGVRASCAICKGVSKDFVPVYLDIGEMNHDRTAGTTLKHYVEWMQGVTPWKISAKFFISNPLSTTSAKKNNPSNQQIITTSINYKPSTTNSNPPTKINVSKFEFKRKEPANSA